MCVYIKNTRAIHMLTYIVNNQMAEQRILIKEIQKYVCI